MDQALKNKRVSETICKVYMDLLSDLELISPGNKKLMLLKTASYSMIFGDKISFAKQITDYLRPYNSNILEKNENFFETQDFSLNYDEYISKEIKSVQDIWKDPKTSSQDKEMIWKYFILIVKLGEKIV